MKNISLSDHFTYKKIILFTLPSVTMMIVTSVYSIVDGFFVSNFAGKEEFAAVNLILPAIMILSSFGFMIGSGGSALVAKIMGEGKNELANQVFSMLIFFVFFLGVFLSIMGIIFMPKVSYFLGARNEILDYCVIYGRIVMLSLPFFMLECSFQSFLVTAEKAKFGLVISICTGIANGILDFILIYYFKLGIGGAAFATSISEIIGGIIPVIYLARKNSSRLRLVKTTFRGRMMIKACSNGMSEMLTYISTSIVGMLYNFQLLKIAAENGVAAYGVIMYLNFIFMAYFFGYAVGIGPVVGFHYGAGNNSELKNILKKSLIVIVCVSLIMTFLSEIFASPLSRMFVGYDYSLCEMAKNGIKLYSISFLICGINIFGSAFFTGLNNGIISAIISFMRTLVFQIISVLLLPKIFGLNGIWLSVVAAEGLTLIITVFLIIHNRKRYKYL